MADFYAYLERVEGTCEDPAALGLCRVELEGDPDLDADEREELRGRIETYLGDKATERDPWERFDQGDGPMPDVEQQVPVADDDRPYDDDEIAG